MYGAPFLLEDALAISGEEKLVDMIYPDEFKRCRTYAVPVSPDGLPSRKPSSCNSQAFATCALGPFRHPGLHLRSRIRLHRRECDEGGGTRHGGEGSIFVVNSCAGPIELRTPMKCSDNTDDLRYRTSPQTSEGIVSQQTHAANLECRSTLASSAHDRAHGLPPGS